MKKLSCEELEKIKIGSMKSLLLDDVTNSDLQIIADILPNNNHIKNIKFQNGQYDCEACEYIKVIIFKSTLTELTFDAVQISHQGLKLITEALIANLTINTLSFWNCHIGYSGIMILKTYLESALFLNKLELWNNDLSGDGIKILCDTLKSNKALLCLNLGKNNINYSDADNIKQLLIFNQSLIILDLWDNNIDARGFTKICEGLAANVSLGQIEFYGNSIGSSNDGVEALKRVLTINDNLTSINLGNNSINDQQAVILNQALELNKGLAKIDLSENNISRHILHSIRLKLNYRSMVFEKASYSACKILPIMRVIANGGKDNTFNRLPIDVVSYCLHFFNSSQLLSHRQLAKLYLYAKDKKNIGKSKIFFFNHIEGDKFKFYNQCTNNDKSVITEKADMSSLSV